MENTTSNQEVIPVSGFNGLHFKAVGKVMLSQGESDGLTIQADPEVRALIHSEVKDGILGSLRKQTGKIGLVSV